VELVLKKSAPALHKSLGIFLPFITTNCAVLGVAVLNISLGLYFIGSILFGFGGAAGFGLALVLFAGIREKLDRANPPRPFQGTALALVTAGLLSLAFMGFANLVK
jgi:electron transport complex protein RnfA